jgi:hypothetical protein
MDSTSHEQVTRGRWAVKQPWAPVNIHQLAPSAAMGVKALPASVHPAAEASLKEDALGCGMIVCFGSGVSTGAPAENIHALIGAAEGRRETKAAWPDSQKPPGKGRFGGARSLFERVRGFEPLTFSLGS